MVWLPSAWQRLGEGLLHQQCWCWGCDIRRSAGNLLLARGFDRHRPPAGEQGSNRYTLDLPDGARLHLWGFGLCYHLPGRAGLILNRYEFRPRLVTETIVTRPIWLPDHLGPRARPATADDWRWVGDALPTTLAWIAAYERWVLERCGGAYRGACLAAWSKAVRPADQMALTWQRLADECQARIAAIVRTLERDDTRATRPVASPRALEDASGSGQPPGPTVIIPAHRHLLEVRG